MGLNVFQYPSKIVLAGPKGLQEIEFNPQQRLLFRSTGKGEKHLFLLSGPVKRANIQADNTPHPSAQTPQASAVRARRAQKQDIISLIIYKRPIAFHKLSVSKLKNAIIGVYQGFTKKLKIKGVGFRASLEGVFLRLDLGFSHEVKVRIPSELEINMEGTDTILIKGSCKWAVGKFASEIRLLRPAEPYKGKGIAYEGEVIRYKSAKAGR
jgi:ribosomal protein L6P/L9E